MLQSMRSAARYIWIGLAIAFVGGFVFYESSGLFGQSRVTTSTAVAKVNGTSIPYQQWANLTQSLSQQQEQRLGRGLTLDERKRVEDEAFDQLVTDVLLNQEYRRRGIRVTDAEIQQAAMTSPPNELMQSPELQTEGRFDPEKYQRFLRSPAAKAQGLLVQLEGYYRNEIPKEKLYSQVASDVYLSDKRLWSIYQDTHDSAQMSYVALRPDLVADSAVKVSDAEIREYYDAHQKALQRPGRAVVSVIEIPRVVTAADSEATRQRLLALRGEIASGTSKFEDVAKRESVDSSSAVEGGSLGTYVKGSGFVAPFENAAFALKPGELSQPVLSPFGYHLIRVDTRKGDTLTLHHILLKVAQSDSSAARTDRRADSLANLAAGATDPKKLDEAARKLNLVVSRATAVEGQAVQINGHAVEGVSGWAFGGAQPGETSDLLDSPDGYYVARLDSLKVGGIPSLADARDDIRGYLAVQKKVELLAPRAKQIADAAARGSLESAAQAAGVSVDSTSMFNRLSFVPGVGQFNEAIGAAFVLPVGAISQPIKTNTGAYVIRVNRRTLASQEAWQGQKDAQRAQLLNGMRQQRVQEFLNDLRASANIKDNRREIQAANRPAAS